ncbi:hypothetical protein NEOLEDRAFT_1151234 [Neolentinus lepideus HHB14362 ss-1]|uniref:Uncharacterized protein n=1 Tax=Neolentinus lepideus HHB14362 ss-1 TaxID=1314782 RepID=A0A165P8H7_9AGAM|nr:hypothetical protein NEOLEDRAFT_1151234 [Neolentinus lepideus HHB14362 ss-1]
MSFSVDELVASLKSNHIGQEAMDLAALQVQLSQTLFTSASTSQRHDAEPFHCNTPTASTPSSSFSWSHMSHRRKGSVASISMEDDIAEMEEDERIVEELLFSPPATTSATHHHNQRAPSSPIQASAFTHRNSGSSFMYTAEPTSIFATQDPFYLAQMQASQTSQNMHSFFAQAGRPAQHSPFVQAHERSHSVLMAAAGAFDR